MHTIATIEENDEPTKKESPSGKWIVSVDRGARKLAAAIHAIDAGAEPADVVETLREAHALVNGGAQ